MKPENVKCPLCDGPMISRSSKHGRFWGCANFPKCRGTRDSDGLSFTERRQERRESRDDEDNDEIADTRRPTRRW